MEEYVKTKGFFKDTIAMLKDEIHDLEAWSVYNNDALNEEINEVKLAVQNLEKQWKLSK